jgi:BASS family bile acid:Na+ symporter
MSPIFTPASREYLRLYSRTGGLLLAMGAGVLTPAARALTPLIPYLVAAMLFLSSLDLPIRRRSFRGSVWRILAANIGIAFLGYYLLLPVDRTLAIVAFLTGITPTAISAPVIIEFLDGDVEAVVASVLATNLCMALILPFLLPVVAGTETEISTLGTLLPVFLVVCVPLGLSRGVSYLPDGFRRTAGIGKPFSFYIWLVALFIVTANASAFLRSDAGLRPGILWEIAAVSLVICVVNFGFGALLGGKNGRREGSQSLGQKNNSFTIWLALAFINPVVALGPTWYVLYHNSWNSIQIIAFERRRKMRERAGEAGR